MSGNKKISQLNNATALDGTELVPVVQSGQTVKTTAQDIANLYTTLTKYKESFTYAGSSLTLSNNCSFMISLNWGNLGLNEGVDYTVSGTTLTILNTNINNGDLLYATYE